ncbi:TIGR00282 family metallophosphoesterase [Maricaulis sp.]|uniref:TIGR00282 family metallophosphoesterase n=1 Tax=Maricaulis sp. TaxID=1486257 RepID=UPI002601B8AE|nr:TIGR00282 family metallophosphoesterase [Maricaulis sp.]
MRFAFFGDIVGKTGRRAAEAHLADLRERLSLDLVIMNAENAAAGFGITERISNQLFDIGADVLTLGNHAWDQREALSFIEREPRLLRPANYPVGSTPGKGANLYESANGHRVLVINVMGNLFMETLDDPFAAVERELGAAPLGEVADAVIVDVHAEATSEKNAMGVFCDGRASLVVGTHTHIPTADTRILPGGTAYQTDAGMCGDYDSVIGMDKEEPVRRFTTRMRTARFEPATGEATLCGVFVETDPATGLAVRAEPIRVGGQLAEQIPAV